MGFIGFPISQAVVWYFQNNLGAHGDSKGHSHFPLTLTRAILETKTYKIMDSGQIKDFETT